VTLRCNRCGQDKPEDCFTKRNSKRGFLSACKRCVADAAARLRAANPERSRQLQRDWYAKNPEKMREASKAWRLANPDKVRDIQRKNNRVTAWHTTLVAQCKRRGQDKSRKQKEFAPCDFDGDYLLLLWERQAGRCYWLDIPMVPSIAHRDPQRPSLDRLDPSIGYVKGNVVLTCQFANLGRSTTSVARTTEFLESLRAFWRGQDK
jgi:hypothetical protein